MNIRLGQGARQRAALLAFLIVGLAFAASPWGLRALQREAKAGRATHRVQAAATVSAVVPPIYSLELVQVLAVQATNVVVADMTGDGKDDLCVFMLTLTPEPYMLLYPQLPGGTLGQPVRIGIPRSLHHELISQLVSADLNEDGRKDLVTTLKLGGIAMLLSQPGGGFSWSIDKFDPRTVRNLVVDDFNGDGHKDVVVFGVRANPQPYTSSFAAYFGDGKGGFSQHVVVPTGEDEGYSLASGDFDGDGDADLASFTRNGPGHGIVLRKNGGAQGILPASVHYGEMTESHDGIVIADVNGDGRKDLVTHNSLRSPRNQILTFLQNLDGSLSKIPARTSSDVGYPVLIANFLAPDLNNDGRADLVFSYASYPDFYYLLSKPDRLGDQVYVSPGIPAGVLAFGDLNSDGLIDIANAGGFAGVSILHGKLTPYAGNGGLPPAPAIGTATVDPQGYDHTGGSLTQVFVSFSAPVSNGGTPITGYRVYSSPGGAFDVDAGTTALTHRLVRLDNGKDYRFFVAATNAAGQGPDSGVSNLVQIRDTPFVRIEEYPYAYEGDVAKVKLTLAYPALPGGASIQMTTLPGTAAAGVDYVQTTSWVNIPEGQTEGVFEVPTVPDFIPEPGKNFTVKILALTGAAIMVDRDTRSVALADDDIDPTGRLNMDQVAVKEGDSGSKILTLVAYLEHPVPNDVQFDIATFGGSATPGVDYLALGPVHGTIPAGSRSTSFDVTILGDTQDEEQEYFSIKPTNLVNAEFPWPPNIYINDDDFPSLTLASTQVLEGNSGTSEATVVATLSHVQQVQIQFDAVTVDGTGAALSGEDYLSRVIPGMVIPPGETSKSFSIPIKGDRKVEPNESFQVALTNVLEATPGPAATVTISNDDSPGILSIEDVSVEEGDSGVSQAKFVINLSQAQGQPVSFDFYAAAGTAAPGSDFSDITLTGLSIAPGQTSLTVNVPVFGDTAVEDNETFTGNLNNVSGAVVAVSQARGLIMDDELPDAWIEDMTIVEGDEGLKSAYFNIRLSRPVNFPVRFDIASDMRAPTYYYDYQADYKVMQIDPGRTLVRYEVRIVGDTLYEGNDNFNIFIQNVQNANVVDDWGVGTIIDDDPAAMGKVEPQSMGATKPIQQRSNRAEAGGRALRE